MAKSALFLAGFLNLLQVNKIILDHSKAFPGKKKDEWTNSRSINIIPCNCYDSQGNEMVENKN